MENKHLKINDPWESLKQHTAARIALGRVGTSVPLKNELEFRLAHANARDAVYSELDQQMLADALIEFGLPVLSLHSQAKERKEYLQRPDLGRSVNSSGATLLANYNAPSDICILLADGLSADAINKHVISLLQALFPLLKASAYSLTAICLVAQARVAIADDIASALGARLSLILIGERPGLSSADSIGAYLTYQPQPGLTDESRNCISNIRPGGLSFELAARKIFYLVQEAFGKGFSGVLLKDNEGLLEK